MTENAPAAPAGWYPDPSGVQRYWDGERWLSITPPEQDSAPDEGTPVGRRTMLQSRRAWIWGAVIIAAIVAAGATGLFVKAQHDRSEAEAAAAQQAAEEAEKEAAEEAAADREKAAQERQDAADRAERELRAESVVEIEKAIKVMAEEDVVDGLIDGPILEVHCDPVGGGSTDDLTQKTTVFQCFVANEDNGDGTMSGFYYNSTMNWDSGQYTYGFGQP